MAQALNRAIQITRVGHIVQPHKPSAIEESLILEVWVNSVVVPVLHAFNLFEAQVLVKSVISFCALFRAVVDLLAVTLQKLGCRVV